jgi:hypothetical protein
MCDFRGMIEEEHEILTTPKSKKTTDAMDGQKVSMGDFGMGTFESNPFDVSQSTNNLALKK